MHRRHARAGALPPAVFLLLLAALANTGSTRIAARQGKVLYSSPQNAPPAASTARKPGSAPLMFTGMLVAVTATSAVVRQVGGIVVAAELPTDGSLPGKQLARDYPLGEYVQINCTRLATPRLDLLSGHMGLLELTAIFDLGKPSHADLEAAADSRAADTPGNLLAGAPSDGDAYIYLGPDGSAHAPAGPPVAPARTVPAQAARTAPAAGDAATAEMRDTVLDYVAQMPNYIADESALRSTGLPAAGGAIVWQQLDTIADTVAIVDGALTRSDIRRNGSPWTQPVAALPGQYVLEPFWESPVGVLAPVCPAKIDSGQPTTSAGTPALAFAFTTPPDGCGAGAEFQEGFEQYYPATAGQLIVGRADGSPLQMERHTTGFPAQFPVQYAAYAVAWGDVTVAGQTYRVPTAATVTLQLVPGGWSRTVYSYTNYRHFTVSHTITLTTHRIIIH